MRPLLRRGKCAIARGVAVARSGARRVNPVLA